MSRLFPILVTAFFLLCGCTSNLTVQVDVMNPAYAAAAVTEARMLQDINELASGGHSRAGRVLSVSQASMIAFVDTCYDLKIASNEAAGAADANTLLRSLKADLSPIHRIIDRERPALEEADKQARASIPSLSSFAGLSGFQQSRNSQNVWATPLPDEAKAALMIWQMAYDQHAENIRGYVAAERIGTCSNLKYPKLEVQAETAEDIAQKQVTQSASPSVVGDGTLLNYLPHAYFVTRAGDSAWAPNYNHAFGRGFGGNTSVALKLNNTADFSVKGFVFDGRATADMVKKLSTLAVSTVAAAYGAPVALTPGQGGAPSQIAFTPDSLLSDPEIAIAADAAKNQAFRNSLFQIGDTVVANFAKLRAGDGAATGIVNATIAANKSTYSGSTPGSGDGTGP
ncbi:hypothetical protein EEB18_000420 [Sphingopyxis sp. OPL5]|uniref:hypothetical protein n=1 Tax=Sphingopyxis sp. OPL5 TaxID=2486273 RepID=UPI00164DF16F|nr:hypothetical protein [Sphingopyxis sp. OPL5]QNO27505.1 hypothetical protein EEB18_000420 [Sphingopyxis sp. OPL5]